MSYYEVDGLTLLHGDCREVMVSLPECSVDAIVTDPPYGIGFMGKAWDKPAIGRRASARESYGPSALRLAQGRTTTGFTAADATVAHYDLSVKGKRKFQDWCAEWGAEALRVLKPGGHAVVFGSPRTYHRLASGLEDAGFEIRDCLQWLFGSGFPKSLNLHGEWEGWGTALKPAYEPIVLARKPIKGTVAANVQAHGTGGINIDATRIGSSGGPAGASLGAAEGVALGKNLNGTRGELVPGMGRWPANVALDEEAARLLDAQSGESASSGAEITSTPGAVDGAGAGLPSFTGIYGFNDRGGASRFFYTAKTSKAEREFGLDDVEPARRSDGREKDIENPRLRTTRRRNDHPTVKPIDLMRWLCRLITPLGGVILDPFLGSGSTGMAALGEGFRFIGIDIEDHYLEIAQRRIARRHLLDKLPEPESQEGNQGVMF